MPKSIYNIHRDGLIQAISDVSSNIDIPKYIGIHQMIAIPMYRPESPSQNTSEFIVFSQSRCIPINFPRVHIHPLAAYPRANQPHLNFPRLYSHPLAAYPRASQPHITQRELYIMYSSRCRTPNKTITQNIISL